MPNIIPFDPNSKQLPAHIAKALATVGENIDERLTVPQLSFRGKVWRTVIDGEETTILNKDDEPVSTIGVVVLDHNKARSRAYYEGAFAEGKAQRPTCWSTDGETPDVTVGTPQCSTCAKCQWSVKGSKITANNKETTACSVFKRIAVTPVGDISPDFEGDVRKLVVRLPQTSMWDGDNADNEAKGYYAWDQYLNYLRKSGAAHTGLVVTTVRFDSRMAYPKLLFAASRWLSEEELANATPLFKDEEVTALLRAPESKLAARAGDKIATNEDAAEAAAAQAVSRAAKTAAAADDTDDAPPPPKAKKGAAAVTPPPSDDDDDMPVMPPPAKTKKAAAPVAEEAAPPPKASSKAKQPLPTSDDDDELATAPAAPKKGTANAGLANLLDEWEKPS